MMMMERISLYVLLHGAAYVALLLWIFIMIAHVIAIVSAKIYLYSHRYQSSVDQEAAAALSKPGVSIIRPINVMSKNVMNNLESLFQLQYPMYEILICVQDADHEVLPHIHELILKYPNADVRVSAGALEVGVNPKINNMMQLYPEAKYPIVWICDSGIRVHADLLMEMASHLAPDVGMVHQLPYVTTGKGFAACLEKVYFGTQHARWYLCFNFLGFCCVNGMSNLVNREYLEQVGGLKAFSDFIAEDYFMSNALFNKGYKTVISTEPAIQTPDRNSISGFINRMTRWTRLRLTMEPFTIFEPVTESFLIGALMAISVSYLWGYSFVWIYLFHISLWFFLDQILNTLVQGSIGELPPLWKRTCAWLLREFVTYFVLIRSVWSKRISWRAGTFNLMRGGKAKLVEWKQS